MAKTLAHHLGVVIRELRKEAGLSQIMFGEKCGFYQTYLSRIENGSANPTINAIEVIAKALGISIFDLLGLVKSQMEQSKSR
ncbi:helix-turn-helix transcriptional regulator [Polynucleobacter paneuropaeus]|jgi:transcriptional regulator with XRE-family HTH domain|nr:helix-turn-helix transcriptional regulator [Polynucleobacter paneuropaeus]MBT8616006.1 helix-turn-helix transcriptional regulator [Polynucleobacter paneuropaeus]MBT8617887.1 helix-turn-helix transcriptional regulator [Polynucleobacter paneuropaeus]MBT8619768.1 helix-turn-helix transcriptional regulator [Polynucleobacter paneuropaeus]MBT8625303.1 helix-turn-helix transcriptional regulator [Polynucleobacter paneuropaeus]